MEQDLRELERLLIGLAREHAALGELLGEQRRAMRKADAGWIAEVGGRIELQAGRIAALEARRRQVTGRLTGALGLGTDQNSTARLGAICRRVAGGWAGRLSAAAGKLTGELDRVRRAGRVNQFVAHRLADLFGDMLGQVGRLSRQTGCYDRRGCRAVAGEGVAVNCFSAVG